MQHEFTSPEYNRLRRIARICTSQLPEPFAVDALLMLYDVCRAHELTPEELLHIFGRQGLTFVLAGKHTAPRENPVVYSKMDLTWDRPFVVTQIGYIGHDHAMHRAEDARRGGQRLPDAGDFSPPAQRRGMRSRSDQRVRQSGRLGGQLGQRHCSWLWSWA